MRSIRRHLVTWLMLWLGVAWTAGGIGAFWMVRTGALATFDAELNRIAASLPLLLRPPQGRVARIAARYPEFDKPRSGLYFTAWTADGEILETSTSLEGRKLLRPQSAQNVPLYSSHELQDGEPVRAVALRPFAPPPSAQRPRPAPVEVVVCRNRTDLDKLLSQWLLGITASVVLGCLGSALVVLAVLRAGLRPLQALASRAGAIDDRSLATRFEVATLPAELVPIGSRLNDLLARLETSFERERRFGSDLAHELRTPVAELKSMAEVGLHWPTRRRESDYSSMLTIAERMQRLIEDLLSLARLEQHFGAASREPVDVSRLVAECLAGHDAKIVAKRLTIELDLAPGLVVRSLPSLLDTILGNLIANAVEYTGPGGSIRIEGGPRAVHGIHVVVANAPCGLTEAEIPHLFDRFWRGDQARPGDGHTGLGLALARACATALSARLEARLTTGGWLRLELDGLGADVPAGSP